MNKITVDTSGVPVGGVPKGMDPKMAAEYASKTGATGGKRVNIPVKYGSKDTTDLTWEIKSGEQEKELVLND